MEENLRQLLLKDLCARLPYGVVCYNSDTENNFELCDVADLDSGYATFDYGYGTLETIRPYLRPMSSMTPEEFKEYTDITEHISIGSLNFNICNPETFDYLNKNMFDYRGLIDKGLAIEVTEENNPYKD